MTRFDPFWARFGGHFELSKMEPKSMFYVSKTTFFALPERSVFDPQFRPDLDSKKLSIRTLKSGHFDTPLRQKWLLSEGVGGRDLEP